MPLIVVEGPEKAGKSTFIEVLRTEVVDVERVRHASGPPQPDHRQYAEWLADDMPIVREGGYVVWDRAWLGEVVYPELVEGREGLDWFTAEWLYGRAADACGMKIVLLGPSIEILMLNRTHDDIDVSPHRERALFMEYGMRGGWYVIVNQHDMGVAREHAREVAAIAAQQVDPTLLPPDVAGPIHARTIVVGEGPNRSGRKPLGGGLPFTTRLTTMLAQRMRELGGEPLNLTWSNAHTFPPQRLAWYDTVIACGRKALDWCRLHGNLDDDVLVGIPHPSWLYRYENERTAEARDETDRVLAQLIRDRRV